MRTSCAFAAAVALYAFTAAAEPPVPKYSEMPREQLLRERAHVADERPGLGGIGMAWLGTVLAIPGATASLVFGLVEGSRFNAGATGPVLISTAIFGYALSALCIYFIATKTPEWRRLGAELDIIDDALETKRPSP